MGARTLLLPGSKLEIGLSVPRSRWADQLRIDPLWQLLCRMGTHEPYAVARVQSEESDTTLAGRMCCLASDRAGPDRGLARRVCRQQGERAWLAGYISASRSMMNHLGGTSKAANSDNTSSSGNAAFTAPHRRRLEPRAARRRIPRLSASQARTFEAFCQKIASISKRTNSPRPKGRTRAISCNIC